MHFYKEKSGDTVLEQRYPNGTLYSYTVLNRGIQANGWSRKKHYPTGSLQEEENFSNGLLIEKINYSESGTIISHKIWNNRLKELVDKPPVFPLPKHNVVTGYAAMSNYLKHMPSISEFIQADYQKDSLMQSFKSSMTTGEKEAKWTLSGKQMSFTIYWDCDEIFYHWHCHCTTEELYLKARNFLDSKGFF